jgi:glutamyl-tRNA synthetase
MPKAAPARVRFAPSPTGRFHIGGARTALYDFLLARQTGGSFILRIEDTDTKRTVAGAEKEIKESLRWLGLDWDEGPDIGGPHAPYRQSERKEIYLEHAHELVERGWAFYCFCAPLRLAEVRKEQQKKKQPPHYDGLCRMLEPAEVRQRLSSGESSVIRFRTPKEGTTTAVDLLRGPITVENANLDDYILLKSDGLPVYHLAAMVDDHLMEITHVLRSSEWLPSFPLHVLIYQAFEWDQPEWVHLSVFLNPSGKGKMSKREAAKGAKSIYTLDMRESGYPAEAVLNWLALMGWSYDDRTEQFSLQELVEKFSLERLNPSPAAVNYSKLDHFSGVHIRKLDLEELTDRMLPFFLKRGIAADRDTLLLITPIIQERMRTLEEGVDLAAFFFQEHVDPEVEQLIGKKMTPGESANAVSVAERVIFEAQSMDVEILEPLLRNAAEQLELKVGQFFGVLRVAVTGQRVSPPLIESMMIVGKEKVLARLASAREKLEALAAD